MGEIKKARALPTLVEVGNKQVVSSGRWNDNLMAEYVIEHGRNEWLDIGEFARLVFRNNSEAHRKYVRQRLHRLFNHLITKGWVLVVEYNGENRSASAVKLYDGKTETERQAAQVKLDRMKQRGDLAADKYAAALEILKAQEQPQQEADDGNVPRL